MLVHIHYGSVRSIHLLTVGMFLLLSAGIFCRVSGQTLTLFYTPIHQYLHLHFCCAGLLAISSHRRNRKSRMPGRWEVRTRQKVFSEKCVAVNLTALNLMRLTTTLICIQRRRCQLSVPRRYWNQRCHHLSQRSQVSRHHQRWELHHRLGWRQRHWKARGPAFSKVGAAPALASA